MSLVFNISPDYVRGYFVSYTPYKIFITPKLSRPQLLSQLRKLPKYFTGRYTLQYLHHLRRRIPRWCLQKNMYVIFHNFHRIYPELILPRNPLKYFLQVARHLPTQYLFPVLRYPNQVILQIIYRVFRPSYSHAIFLPPIQVLRQTLHHPPHMGSHFPRASKLAGIQWSFL